MLEEKVAQAMGKILQDFHLIASFQEKQRYVSSCYLINDLETAENQ